MATAKPITRGLGGALMLGSESRPCVPCTTSKRPAATRSPTVIRRTFYELGKRVRARVAAGEQSPELADRDEKQFAWLVAIDERVRHVEEHL
jgi:hypothetical protein